MRALVKLAWRIFHTVKGSNMSSLGRRAAEAFLKQAVNSADMLPMDTWSGWLADHLQPNTWGGTRAGRGEQMAESIGVEPGFNVRHPVMGGLAGAAGGGLAGAAIGGLTQALYASDAGDGTGAALGGGLGMLTGLLGAGTLRRDRLKTIAKKFDKATERNNKPPEFSSLATYALPYRGAHRTGQIDAYEAMRDDQPVGTHRGRDVMYALRALTSGAPGSELLDVGHGYYQNLASKQRLRNER